MARADLISSWVGLLRKQTSLITPLVLLVVLLIVSAVRGPYLFNSGGLAGALIVAAPLILVTSH